MHFTSHSLLTITPGFKTRHFVIKHGDGCLFQVRASCLGLCQSVRQLVLGFFEAVDIVGVIRGGRYSQSALIKIKLST